MAGVRKQKRHPFARTFEVDVDPIMGDMKAVEAKRTDIIELIMGIVERGAKLQAGNLLKELNGAFEYAIGLGKFLDEFMNPALAAKTSLART